MWRNLWRVGREKRIGYLPLYTVRDPPRLSAEGLAAEAAPRGLSAAILDAAECRIESGALCVFHRQELATPLADAAAALNRVEWPAEPDGFVRAIAAEWPEPGHPVLPVVREASGDHAAGWRVPPGGAARGQHIPAVSCGALPGGGTGRPRPTYRPQFPARNERPAPRGR